MAQENTDKSTNSKLSLLFVLRKHQKEVDPACSALLTRDSMPPLKPMWEFPPLVCILAVEYFEHSCRLNAAGQEPSTLEFSGFLSILPSIFFAVFSRTAFSLLVSSSCQTCVLLSLFLYPFTSGSVSALWQRSYNPGCHPICHL